MKSFLKVFLFVGILGDTAELKAWDYESLEPLFRDQLSEGGAVSFPLRPDESDELDGRFVTVGQMIKGSREGIWVVINDKEDAEKFVDGVLESKVIEEGENLIVAAQRTKVGGPKGSYRYTLRHELTPMIRADFSFVEGEMRNVIGSWWIFDGPDSDTFLVVYSLFIDPGLFAPQFVVKSGMKKSMPGTLLSMQREVLRRRNLSVQEEKKEGTE
tara:strand:- start:3484 stop:4125 length:642 start_codon:yes stop_codon:yes gene_type:complete